MAHKVTKTGTNTFSVEKATTNSVRNIPGWASWDEATALQWVDDNVTDLQSAKTAIKAITRMMLALRDETWPNLAG